MITARTHGAPNWVDLSTTDLSGAIDFYRGLFGWAVERTDTPMGDYFVGKIGDRQIAGMMAAPPGEQTPPMWTTFIYVEDVDATAAKARQAGGAVLQEPFDLPEGRVGVIADPSGGMLGILSGVPAEGTWLSTDAGSVGWIELLTRDVNAAETFYGEVFGWKAETQMHGDTSYTTFSIDGDAVAGMMPMPAELGDEVPTYWSVYFSVDDCAEAVETLERLGGVALRPARQIEMGHFAVVADPQGAVFQLMDYAT